MKKLKKTDINEEKALSFKKQGDFSSALAIYTQLVILDHRNPEYFYEKALIHLELDEQNYALECLDIAVNLEPKNPFRFACRAFVKASIKDYNGAVDDYKTAISLDPEDAISINNLGLVQEQLGYVKQSGISFEKADELLKKSKSSVSKRKVQVESPDMEIGKFKVIQKVLTDKKMLHEFIKFLKNGFKINHD